MTGVDGGRDIAAALGAGKKDIKKYAYPYLMTNPLFAFAPRFAGISPRNRIFFISIQLGAAMGAI